MGKKYGQKKIALRENICRGKFFAILSLLFLNAVVISYAQAAGTNTLAVSASVRNVCRFSSGATTINFGAINPAGTTNVTRTATMRFVCNGNGSSPMATFNFTSNDGLYETGPGANRMRKTTAPTTEYLPYTLTLSPQSGAIPVTRGTTQTLTITGTVTPANYRSAYFGNYRDTVIISLNP